MALTNIYVTVPSSDTLLYTATGTGQVSLFAQTNTNNPVLFAHYNSSGVFVDSIEIPVIGTGSLSSQVNLTTGETIRGISRYAYVSAVLRSQI